MTKYSLTKGPTADNTFSLSKDEDATQIEVTKNPGFATARLTKNPGATDGKVSISKASSGPSILFTDNFTEAGDTPIESHTPTPGPGGVWSVTGTAGGTVIASTNLVQADANAETPVMRDIGETVTKITCTLVQPQSGRENYVYLRAASDLSGGLSGWRIRVRVNSAAATQIYYYKEVGAVWALQGGIEIGDSNEPGIPINLTIEDDGTTIMVSYNANTYTRSDTDHAGNTWVGFAVTRTGAGTIDDFEVTG